MAQTIPSNNEPVSPINIFAGVILYFKKAIVEPAILKATIANSIRSIKKNHVPSVIAIRVPILPERPLIPSIKLNALIITSIVNIDKTTLNHSGIWVNPKIPYRLVKRIFALNTNIKAAKSWPKNFLEGEMGSISSLAPMRNIMMKI